MSSWIENNYLRIVISSYDTVFNYNIITKLVILYNIVNIKYYHNLNMKVETLKKTYMAIFCVYI